MKKIFYNVTISLLFASTFFCFSCASKDEVVDNQDTIIETPTDASTNNTEEQTSESEFENQKSEVDLQDYPILDEIEEIEVIDEPLVIDFFPIEENQQEANKDISKEESEIIIKEEIIEDFDVLQPLEPLSEDTTLNQDNNKSELITEIQNQTDLTNFPNIEIESETTNEAEQKEESDSETEKFDESEIKLLYENIVPSRKITINLGEKVIITYPGLNWKFYGITDKSKDLELLKRKQIRTNTAFEFIAKGNGTKILHFYKLDNLTQNYIDDFIEIQIVSNNSDDDIVIDITDDNDENEEQSTKKEQNVKKAPQYKKIESPKKIGTKKTIVEEDKSAQPETDDKPTQTKTATQTINEQNNQPSQEEKKVETNKKEKTVVEKSNQKTTQKIETTPKKEELLQQESKKEVETKETISTPEENIIKELTETEINNLLVEANNLFKQKKYKESLEKVKAFLEFSASKRDEALYLQAQLYETQSEIKDIKQAIKTYNTIIENYPTSKYWDEANKRVIYLNRFYMKGR